MEVSMTMKIRRLVIPGLGLALSLLLLFPIPGPAQAAKTPLTLEGMISITSVGTVALSPSGKSVAFDVTSVDWARNTFTTDVWLADVESGRSFAVTKGPDM